MTALVHFKYEGKDYCFEHPQDDHIGRVQQQSRTFYELDLLKHLRRSAGERQGTVVDIGAHVGNHTVYFANYLGPVLAFEPNRNVFGLLAKNVERNTKSAVSLISGAFWDTPAIFATCLPTLEHNTGTNTVTISCSPVNGAVFTFDYSVLRGLPIKLIKIDVEGTENRVLTGLQPVLKSQKPVLALEASTPEAFREQQRVLEAYGYKHEGPFCKTPTYVWASR